jgi:dihydroneopterin aldolase
MNEIIIRELTVKAHIGVPEEERREAQHLLVNITMTPRNDFTELEDNIDRTVDYHLASRRVIAVAAERPRKLIETLAAEIVEMLLKEFAVERAEVEVRKFILPDTKYVAVRHGRSREG